jgi:hypothetical protein
MSLSEVVIEGTLKPDGTLVLDQKPNLPPGRVQVMVRPMTSESAGQRGVLEVIAEIRRNQQARGHVPRSREEIDAEINELRQAAEEEMQEVERLHEECQRAKREAAQGKEPGQ